MARRPSRRPQLARRRKRQLGPSALSLREDLGFRTITLLDTRFEFRSGNARMDQDTLTDYYRWSREKDTHVVVWEKDGRPRALLLLQVAADHLVLERVAKDVGAPKGVLPLLFDEAEGVARQLGKPEIRLEATADWLVALCATRQYEVAGPTRSDEEWGQITPMRKKLG